MKSTAIYTVLIGNGDTLLPPIVESDADYVCFTDQDITCKPWQIVKVESSRPAVQHAKRYKMMPHWYFPDYKESVWVDANMIAKKPLVVRNDMAFYRHPTRDCVYQESKEVVRQRLVEPEVVRKQMKQYRKDSYPDHNGLIAGYVIYRRHNDPRVIAFCEAWYRECNRWCWRDQLSANKVAWDSGMDLPTLDNPGYGEESSDFDRIAHKPRS